MNCRVLNSGSQVLTETSPGDILDNLLQSNPVLLLDFDRHPEYGVIVSFVGPQEQNVLLGLNDFGFD